MKILRILNKDLTLPVWLWLFVGFISQPIYEFLKGFFKGVTS